MTRDLLNQSRIGASFAPELHHTGKHGIVLVSCAAGMVPFTREHAGAAYTTVIRAPALVVIPASRGRYSGLAAGTRPSTRLSTSTGVNVTGGTETLAPSCPVRVIESRNITGSDPPAVGNDWDRA